MVGISVPHLENAGIELDSEKLIKENPDLKNLENGINAVSIKKKDEWKKKNPDERFPVLADITFDKDKENFQVKHEEKVLYEFSLAEVQAEQEKIDAAANEEENKEEKKEDVKEKYSDDDL